MHLPMRYGDGRMQHRGDEMEVEGQGHGSLERCCGGWESGMSDLATWGLRNLFMAELDDRGFEVFACCVGVCSWGGRCP